jgi:hypothetical protein
MKYISQLKMVQRLEETFSLAPTVFTVEPERKCGDVRSWKILNMVADEWLNVYSHRVSGELCHAE